MIELNFDSYFIKWTESYDKMELYSRLLEWQSDIFISFDPGIVGFNSIDNLQLLYSSSETINNTELISVRPLDHTMGELLDEYVMQKLPIQIIKDILVYGGKIRIMNIYPAHFEKVSNFLELNNFTKIEFEHNPIPKKYNFMRPDYYINNEKTELLVLVTPGKDYLVHYASLINHAVAFYTTNPQKHIEVTRFPFVEYSLPFWTHLGRKFISPDEVVVIGYVNELLTYMETQNHTVIYSYENEYYSVNKVKIGNKVISLLGVKFSFWGNIAARIAYHCSLLGISELIYFGKLGTLEDSSKIYSKIYSPSRFCIFYHEKLLALIDHLPNGIHELQPELDTGTHVSVPSILEEDYIQREIIGGLDITSIDNEISQVAYAIAKFNQNYHRNVKYSCLHFATDYLRQLDKRNVETPHDLSNNRSSTAVQKKQAMIANIAKILYSYFQKAYV